MVVVVEVEQGEEERMRAASAAASPIPKSARPEKRLAMTEEVGVGT